MVFSLVWSIISLKAPAEKWSSFHSSGRSTGTATLCSPEHGRPRKDWGHWLCWPRTSSSSTSLLQVCPSWVFSTEHKVLTLPRTRNILVLQVTALESNKILRQLIQISRCSQKLGSQKQSGSAQEKAGGVWQLLPGELALQNRSWGRARWESFREQDPVLANTSGNSANKVFTPLPARWRCKRSTKL